MQPPRDPNDLRYIPVAEGGTGGFSYRYRTEGKPAPYRFRSLDTQTRQMAENDPLSIVATPEPRHRDADYAPDTVKSRARAVVLLAIERMAEKLGDDANPLTLNELSQAVSSLGRVSGVATDEQKDSTVRIHIVRDELPAHVQARMLSAGDDDAPSYGVSDDAATR